jgi:hypothetical protein
MKIHTLTLPRRFPAVALLAGCWLLAAAGCDDSDGNGDLADEEGIEAAHEAADEILAEADADAPGDAALEELAEAEEEAGLPFGCDPEPAAGTLWALDAPDRDSGDPVRLCEYRGEVVLIVNTAAL